MKVVLKENQIKQKMRLLKLKAEEICHDKTLRHIPNEHDIKKCSEHTKLLAIHQQKTY